MVKISGCTEALADFKIRLPASVPVAVFSSFQEKFHNYNKLKYIKIYECKVFTVILEILINYNPCDKMI